MSNRKEYDFTSMRVGRYVPKVEGTTEICPKCGRVGIVSEAPEQYDSRATITHRAVYESLSSGIMVEILEWCETRLL